MFRSKICVVALALPTFLAAQSTTSTVISNIDLSRPFSTGEPWRFIANQGPPVAGDDTASGAEEDGRIQLCLQSTPSAPCDPQLLTALSAASSGGDYFAQPHYLNVVKIVYPRGSTDRPLLFVQAASQHAGNGSQLVLTQALTYENSQNRFVRVYQYTIGTNNNDEVRYIETGRLRGAIISVDPTENAPYGYWVTVNVLTPQYTYKTALRYRSATHYGDGNPLAVIDSEMPNIQQRLGYWKSGMALPLPSGACPRPRLIHMELWCN
ncbi:MAG: hypothetical protein ABSB82_23960 [Terriglobia bacterium]